MISNINPCALAPTAIDTSSHRHCSTYPGAKGLKCRFFAPKSEQAEFGLKLKAMSWSFDFYLSAILRNTSVNSSHSNA